MLSIVDHAHFFDPFLPAFFWIFFTFCTLGFLAGTFFVGLGLAACLFPVFPLGAFAGDGAATTGVGAGVVDAGVLAAGLVDLLLGLVAALVVFWVGFLD